MTEYVWPVRGGSGSGGSAYFLDPVATAGLLPASAPEGTLILVIDEDALYEYRGAAWVLFIDPGTVNDNNAATQADIDAHEADTANPHSVTKTQVGLSNVDNTSDVNKPVSTAQATAIALKIDLTQKGAVNGVATLDGSGLIPSAQLPPIAITDTFVVASQAAQIALTAEVGDVAVRTDLNKSYILRVSPASTFSNWQELLTPTDTVLSVNGQTGAVSITKSDVGLGAVDNISDANRNIAPATFSNKSISGATNTLSAIPITSLNTFASAQLATQLTDETGTGAAVFGTSPTLVTPALGTPTALVLTNATGLPLTTGVTGVLGPANGGGLNPLSITSNTTAVAGTLYECDTTGGAFTLTLPSGTTAAVAGVLDSGPYFQTNNLIVAPASGQSIDTGAANDTITMDVNRSNAIFYRASGSTVWEVQFQALTSIAPGFQTGVTSGVAITAGNIGETISQSRLRSAAVALTTATSANVTAIALTLTPGVWDLYGVVGFTLGATTSASVFQAAISTVSATLPSTDTMGVPDTAGQVRAQYALVAAVINNDIVFLPVKSRVNISVSTTYYLVSQSTFTLSTNSAYGSLAATRVA